MIDDYDGRLVAFMRWARRDLYPKVRDATVFVCVCPAANEPDPKFLLEFATALWFDKPIVIIADRHAVLPFALRVHAVAVYDDLDLDDPVALRAIGDKVEAITRSYHHA